ncbi:ribose ABC transporter permease [candidate division KSB1 bacterium]|nr:MAG: ribose ABC transporter permease [candidate division KSB1 bacterium]
MVLIIGTINPNFYSSYNLQNLTRHIALLSIFAIGEAFVIISGGIDLSVGSIIGFTGLLVAVLVMNSGFPILLALVVVFVIVLLVGFIQGVLITKLSVQPFIITLGGMMILRGIAQTITEGGNLGFGGKYLKFKFIGTGSIYGIPVPVLILIAVAGCAFFITKYTILGKYLYAIGGNIEAARYSGVSVAKVQIIAYIISAGLAGISGIVYAAYLPSASPNVGIAYELYAIAAAVLGGCSLSGGEGTIFGVIIGASIMRLMSNGIVLMGISTFWENTIIGIVIIVAVVFDTMFQRTKK